MGIRSLYYKFAIAFASTSILGVVIVALVSRGMVYRAFSQFNTEEIKVDTAVRLMDYFQENGSWEGVQEVFDSQKNGERW